MVPSRNDEFSIGLKEDGRVGSYVWVDSSPFEFGSDFDESVWVENEPNSVIIYHKTCKEIPLYVKFNESRLIDFVSSGDKNVKLIIIFGF